MSLLRFTGYVLVLVTAGVFAAAMLDSFFLELRLFSNYFYTTNSTANDAVERTYDITAPVMLGKIDPSRKYAVFSTTSAGNAESLGFIFLLPLTTLAWKRIGWDRVVIIVGSSNVWNSDPLLYTVLTSVRELDAIVVLLDAHPRNSVIVSQVRNVRLLSRICITFHSNL